MSPSDLIPPKPSEQIIPICITLKDDSIATLYPIHIDENNMIDNGELYNTLKILPNGLLKLVNKEFNLIIETGKCYPIESALNLEESTKYWFSGFTAVLLSGPPLVGIPYICLSDDFKNVKSINCKNIENNITAKKNENVYKSYVPTFNYSEKEWSEKYLGIFTTKPRFPGRSNHLANGSFMTSIHQRQKGIGKSLGKLFLYICPKLSYKGACHNIVFDSNIASKKIWENLGFKQYGYIPEAARLKGIEGLVGIIIYGIKFD